MENLTPEAELAALLAEPLPDALEREASTFDRLSAPWGHRLVLFGAGNLGRKTLAGLRQEGIEPLAFSDSNPSLWGQKIQGLPVLPPVEAAARFGADSTFVLTIWTGEGHDRMPQRIGQLKALGCERVVTFSSLYWKYPRTFLPHYSLDLPHKVLEQKQAVLEAFGLMADAASRREYLAQIRWRLLADFDSLPDPVAHEIYFPDDLVEVGPEEVFVDCGAYDGDTLQAFLRQTGEAFATFDAFEPDPGNFVRLQRFKEGLMPEVCARIRLHQAATGSRPGTITFDAQGTGSSHVGGDLAVACVTLDGALADRRPTYLKMDIEGAELDTLEGGGALIRGALPVLAICAYHCQDHLWRIPLLMRACSGDYRIFLRPHLLEVWDLVCYAVPAGRLKPTS